MLKQNTSNECQDLGINMWNIEMVKDIKKMTINIKDSRFQSFRYFRN